MKSTQKLGKDKAAKTGKAGKVGKAGIMVKKGKSAILIMTREDFAQKLAMLYEISLNKHGCSVDVVYTWKDRTVCEKKSWLAVANACLSDYIPFVKVSV